MDIEETVLDLEIQNIIASLMKKAYKNLRILINIKIVSEPKVAKDINSLCICFHRTTDNSIFRLYLRLKMY